MLRHFRFEKQRSPLLTQRLELTLTRARLELTPLGLSLCKSQHRCSAHVQALAFRSCMNSTVKNNGSNENLPRTNRGWDCSCFVLSTPFIIGSVLCVPPQRYRHLRVTSISPTVRPHHRTGGLCPLTSIYSFIQTSALLLKCS